LLIVAWHDNRNDRHSFLEGLVVDPKSNHLELSRTNPKGG
jgi:hypothetical protein